MSEIPSDEHGGSTPSRLELIYLELKNMAEEMKSQNARQESLVSALVQQNRIPISTLDKVVDANIRERKVWMTAMFIMLLVFLGLRALAPSVLVGN